MPIKIRPIINKIASEVGVDAELLAAVVWQESRGNQYAIRYEPAFFKKYIDGKKLTGFIPPSGLVTETTERMGRAFSYGLCQVMGATARENGFEGPYLAELFDPEVNLYLGATILKKFIDKHESSHKALLAYNGGGNKDYPLEVFQHLETKDYAQMFL
jgi:soluble lytic murein transglycosylase-like protein